MVLSVLDSCQIHLDAPKQQEIHTFSKNSARACVTDSSVLVIAECARGEGSCKSDRVFRKPMATQVNCSP